MERWAIDRLIPYAKNARTHTDAQVAAIAARIKEWGWTTPALVGEDGGLIAGHARILAARQLGIAEIPVMVAAGWTEAQKRAYVLADNQLAITGSGWDHRLDLVGAFVGIGRIQHRRHIAGMHRVDTDTQVARVRFVTQNIT